MDWSHITLVVTPAELAECRGLGLRLAVVGYRIALDGRLQRHRALDAVPDAVMTVLMDADCAADPDAIAAEAAACRYAAVWLDAVPSPHAEALRDALAARGIAVYVPAELVDGEAIALHDAAVVTGSYAARVAELPTAALWLPPLAHDFTLPSRGEGAELSARQLSDLLDVCGEGEFSPELLARYLTYHAEDGGTHCVLYDDAGTLREKLELAARAGCEVFLPYAPVRAMFADILGV